MNVVFSFQAAHLLQSPKDSVENISNICAACFKLNSLQLRCLLENYRPMGNERSIPRDLIDSVVQIAEETADNLTKGDGKRIQLEEEPDLQLPFLLPEDGYSCDTIRGVPNGLIQFLNPFTSCGKFILYVQPVIR